MAKPKSKKMRKTRAVALERPLAPLPSTGSGFEWDVVEADFFAREADLYRAHTIDSFDDLDAGD